MTNYFIQKTICFFLLLFWVGQTWAQEATLKGVVSDSQSGNPLESAIVQIKNGNSSVLTSNKGEFTFPNAPKPPFTLVVSSVGFETAEVDVNSLTFIAISLKESTMSLSEVVVSSGYTIQNRSEFSGAVSSVTAKQLQNRPAVSFDQLLSGQAAGIDLIQPTSILNATPVLRIRGINTITSGLFPLVVVDGVTVFVGAIGGGIGNNPLADINPNDIEAIDVLKDASAAAIYGSRAANGVMVITTKKGRKGKSKVSYDNWVSRSTPFNMPNMLGAEEYTMIKNEAMVNSGRAPGYALLKNDDGSTVDTD